MERSNRRVSSLALATAALLGMGYSYTAPAPAAKGQPNMGQQQVTSSGKGVQNLVAYEDLRRVFGSGGWERGRRRFVGKRYSASVRQHQRHARKLRNRKAAR